MLIKLLKIGVIITLLLSLLIPATGASASPPPDGPPGLERALEVKEKHVNALMQKPGVAGVGVGNDDKGNPAVIILTEERGVRGLPVSLDGVPVRSVYSGKFYANPKPTDKPSKPPTDPVEEPSPRDRWDRPVPIGVSTGHPDITAGTIGVRVKDEDSNVYALSNNHVYANENEASVGDVVIQPGSYDGGSLPNDFIGTLTDFIKIEFDGTLNKVDAAIALTTTENLSNSTPSDGYGIPKSTTAQAVVGMKVMKYGRTTGLTTGRVYVINATVDVGYDSGTARFENQIIITPGTFSAGGDSGSLIVVNNKRSNDHLKPVGLLFAGSSLYTIANPIDMVLNAFNVSIDGNN